MTAVSTAVAELERTASVAAAPIGPRRPHRAWVLLATCSAVALILLAPLAFLLIEAHGAGTSTVVHLIFRSLTASLLWNTIRLTVVVTLLCAVIPDHLDPRLPRCGGGDDAGGLPAGVPAGGGQLAGR